MPGFRPEGFRNCRSILLVLSILSCVVGVPRLTAQSFQTGIPPFATVDGGPDDINLADNSVHWSFPAFSKAGRGIPVSFQFVRDTTSWVQAPLNGGGFLWSPVFGDFIPSNSNLAVAMATPMPICTDRYGVQQTYIHRVFTSFQDLQGNSHGFDILMEYSTAQGGTCPGPVTTASGGTGDGSGITVTIVLNCASDTGSASGCASLTATLRDGSVMSWPISGVSPPTYGSPTWTDSNGNRITYNWTNNALSSITETLGTTALTYTSSSSSRSASYTSPYGSTASVSMLFQNYQVETKFQCPGITDYPAQSGSLPYKVNLPDGTYYTIGYETLSDGNTTGRIASIRLPTGGTISYSYSGGTNGINCSDGSVATMTRTTPDGTWTYSRVLTLDSLKRTEYSTNTITDPQGNQTVMSLSGYNTGLEMQRKVYQGSVSTNTCSSTITTNCLLSTTVTCYNGMTPVSSCPTALIYTVAPSEITKYTSLSGGPYAEVDTLLNGYSLVTEKDEYDFGASTPTRKASISYANIGGGVQDRPSVVSVTDGSGNFISKTTYTYDEDVSSLKASGASELFQPTCTSGTCRGNLTTLNTYTTSSTYLTKTFTHYDTGQVYQSNDANSAQTTYTYGDCGNSLLTNVSEPLSLSKSYTWNCTGGVMTSATDENGKISYTNYANDKYFWRPDSTKDALSNTTNFTYTGATQAEAVLGISFTASVDVLKTVDSLGRPYLTQQRQAPLSSNFDTSTQYYDTDGRPYEVTMPCVKTAGSTCPATPSTKTTYDGAGRPVQVVDGGGGTVTMTYSQNDVMRTVGPAPSGENVKSRQSQYDGLGRLTSVCEILSSGGTSCGQTATASGYLTSYAYSALTTGGGTQTVVTQGAQTRTYIYDGLGRLTSETNPESGTKTYTYDSVAANYCSNTSVYRSLGDLVATSDAIGNHVCYQYDALHRVTDVTNNAQSTTNFCKRFRYDSVANGVTTQPSGSTISTVAGRLVEAETDSCTSPGSTLITDEWFSYDAGGRTTDMWEQTVHPNYYHSVATFFPNGKVNTLQLANPSLYTMTYTIDGEGRWNTLTDTTAKQNIVTGVTHFPANNPAVVSLTGTDNDAYTFDTNTGRMTQYAFTVGSTPATLKGVPNWNANGTLGSLATTDGFDSGGTMTCNSNYDDLARLTKFDCGSGNWGQSFSYDQYENLTKTVLSGRTGTTWNPGYSTNNHCVGCTYDADGDLTSDGTGTNFWGWNVYSKMSWYNTSNSATCGTAGKCLIYDAFGRIVKMSDGSGGTDIMFTQLGRTAVLSNLNISYARFPAPGGGIAEVNGNSAGINYMHTDWLGNARIMSSVINNTEYTDWAFTPYGERFSTYGLPYTQYLVFAGLTGDFNNGVQWEAENREFSLEGRWLSPDPAGLAAVDMANPQTWNRYAYVAANPFSAIDPTGLGGGVYCRTNQGRPECVRYSADCTQGAGFCPPPPLNGTALDLLTSGIAGVSLSPPRDPGWGPPGKGDVDLRAAGCLANSITDAIWCPGFGFSITGSLPDPRDKMPQVTQWHPPKPTDVVKAPYTPSPYVPSLGECFTNPGNAVELMAESHGEEGGSDVHDPDFPLKLYHNETEMGSQQINAEAGEAKANGAVVVGSGIAHFVSCIMGHFLGH